MIYFLLGSIWAIIIGVGSFIISRSINKTIVLSALGLFFGTIIAYLSTPTIGFYQVGIWAFFLTPFI
jgi:hypothetical protein